MLGVFQVGEPIRAASQGDERRRRGGNGPSDRADCERMSRRLCFHNRRSAIHPSAPDAPDAGKVGLRNIQLLQPVGKAFLYLRVRIRRCRHALALLLPSCFPANSRSRFHILRCPIAGDATSICRHQVRKSRSNTSRLCASRRGALVLSEWPRLKRISACRSRATTP